MIQKLTVNESVASSSKFYGKIWIGFCLKGKRLIVENILKFDRENISSLKMVLEIFNLFTPPTAGTKGRHIYVAIHEVF